MLNSFQVSKWHLSRQHLSMGHLSISGLYQLFLTWLWSNLKSRFLGPSLTDASCHRDICQGNICPSHICPFIPNFFFVTTILFFKKIEQQVFQPEMFFNQKFFWIRIFYAKKKIAGPRIFLDHNLTSPRLDPFLDVFRLIFYHKHFFFPQSFQALHFIVNTPTQPQLNLT